MRRMNEHRQLRGSNDIVTKNQVIESGLFGGGMDVITKFTLIMI